MTETEIINAFKTVFSSNRDAIQYKRKDRGLGDFTYHYYIEHLELKISVDYYSPAKSVDRPVKKCIYFTSKNTEILYLKKNDDRVPGLVKFIEDLWKEINDKEIEKTKNLAIDNLKWAIGE